MWNELEIYTSLFLYFFCNLNDWTHFWCWRHKQMGHSHQKRLWISENLRKKMRQITFTKWGARWGSGVSFLYGSCNSIIKKILFWGSNSRWKPLCLTDIKLDLLWTCLLKTVWLFKLAVWFGPRFSLSITCSPESSLNVVKKSPWQHTTYIILCIIDTSLYQRPAWIQTRCYGHAQNRSEKGKMAKLRRKTIQV